jgi:hypothetical protein
MIETAYSNLYKIFEALPKEHWATAICALLVGIEDKHIKEKLFQSAKEVLEIKTFGQPLRQIKATKLMSFKYRADPYQANDYICGDSFIPSASYYNQVSATRSAEQARNICNLNESSKLITDLLKSITNYAKGMPSSNLQSINSEEHGDTGGNENARTITCAVHPYADCLVPSLAFYLVSDLLPKNITINFKPVDWTQIPDILRDMSVDLTYATQNSIKDYSEKDSFLTIPMKNQTSRMPVLLYKPEKHQDAKASIPRIFSYVGFYASHDKQQHVAVNFGNDKNVSFSQTTLTSDNNSEMNTILALAHGEMEYSGVICTNQGFMWAIDAGLVKFGDQESGDFGSLTIGKVKKESSSDSLVFSIRQHNQNEHNASELSFHLTVLIRHLSNILSSTKDDKNFNNLAAALKAAVVAGYGDDIGMLDKLRAELFVKSSCKGAELYEQELDYRASWWDIWNSTDGMKGAGNAEAG